MKKLHIDKDLWVIENFLSEEEIKILMGYCLEKDNWYTTMRSKDGLVMNKYVGRDLDKDEDGNILQPLGHNTQHDVPVFTKPGGIFERLSIVLPSSYRPHSTIQSYKPVDDHGALEDLTIDWHYEASNENGTIDNTVTGGFVVYINDNFEGGELDFKHKPYKIKPKAGMLVNIPVTEEYTHAVRHTYKNIRHVLYGTCFKDISPGSFKTTDKC
jgi:hypothetical protein